MQTAPVNLDPQQFFQPDVAEPHAGPKVIEKGELAGLGGRLVGHDVEAESTGETVREYAVKYAAIIEQTYAGGALPSLDDQLARTRIQPAASLRDQLIHGFRVKGAAVLL